MITRITANMILMLVFYVLIVFRWNLLTLSHKVFSVGLGVRFLVQLNVLRPTVRRLKSHLTQRGIHLYSLPK